MTTHRVRHIANVLIPNGGYWGAGWTPEEAVRQCLSRVPARDRRSRKNRYSIVRFDANSGHAFSELGENAPKESAACWVDGYGMLCSRWSTRQVLPYPETLAAFQSVRSAN